jgi:DNA-binding GntR family transcriptional regulator
VAILKAANGAGKPLKGIKAVGKPRQMGDIAYTTLKDAIVKGDLHPGQRLVENSLSVQMKISRIPVREAMKKLEQDGLVDRLAKGGFIVMNPSKEEIEETFGIRAVLESYATALATARMDKATLKKLNDTLESYRDALEKKDIGRMTLLNNQLDEIIFTASGSKKLCALINNFRDFISRYRKQLLARTDYAAISLSDHEKIVDAIREGNPEAVEKLVREHLLRGKNILIGELESGGHH